MSGGERDSAGAEWEIRPGMPVWIGGMGLAARAAVERSLVGVRRVSAGSIDRLIVTPLTAEEALYFVQKHAERLSEDGTLWIVCSSDGEVEGGAGMIPALTLALQADGWTPVWPVPLDRGFTGYGFRAARADQA